MYATLPAGSSVSATTRIADLITAHGSMPWGTAYDVLVDLATGATVVMVEVFGDGTLPRVGAWWPMR